MSYFKFDYVKEEELTAPKNVLLAEGKARFYIDKVHTINSKTGQPLTKTDGVTPKVTLQLRVTDSTGREGTVYQDLTTKMAWMVKALSDSIGMPGLYNAQGLDLSRIISKRGDCFIKTKLSTEPKYPDRSVIDKFVAKDIPMVQSPTDTSSDDDDFPF